MTTPNLGVELRVEMADLLEHLSMAVRVGDYDTAHHIWHDSLLRPLLDTLLPQTKARVYQQRE
jgi:hypothetical protein